MPCKHKKWPNLMLVHRLRRWTNLKTTSGERFVLTGMSCAPASTGEYSPGEPQYIRPDSGGRGLMDRCHTR